MKKYQSKDLFDQFSQHYPCSKSKSDIIENLS